MWDSGHYLVYLYFFGDVALSDIIVVPIPFSLCMERTSHVFPFQMVFFYHVVVVFFTLTDWASTIPSNIRGCQSGTWSAGQKKIRGTSTKLQ